MLQKGIMSNFARETIECLRQLQGLEDRLVARPQRGQTTKPKANVQALIQSLRSKILPGILAHHDALCAKGKRSLAAVRHGVCSGCHMALASGNLNALARGDELRRCGNCGRYLYLLQDEQDDVAAASRQMTKTAAGK